ncbi:MAG: RNA methyltransferase [Candidatus Nanohaloarchaea archaeon]
MRAVIVVEPESAENIGFIARLSENFDFGIRLVRPQFNLKESRTTANNAQEKLRDAKIFDDLEKAIEGLDFVIGTKPGKGISSKEFEFRENTSIMLGRESSGLTKEELEICDTVVHIDADYESLNLSHAASVLMYEAYKSKESGVDSLRLNFIKEEFGPILKQMISRANPTKEEIDRLIGELK